MDGFRSYDIAAKAEQPEGATLDPNSMTDE